MALEPCPSSPNCISTQADPADTRHYMAPIELSSPPDDVLDVVQAVLEETSGAEVAHRTADHIDAVFTTRIFRFKDDVSFTVEGGKLHFRSASRLGHSDLGANRKRMTALLPQIEAKL
ncbi:MAG: DUF1499 domain-containing protein [Acidimicrobiales bacterium]